MQPVAVGPADVGHMDLTVGMLLLHVQIMEGEAADPLQGVPEDLTLEPALVLIGDVAVFGPAHRQASHLLGTQRVGQLPDVPAPVVGGRDHLHDVGAPELGLLSPLGEPGLDDLPRDGMPDEDDPPLMAGHAVASVGHRPHLQGEHLLVRRGGGLHEEASVSAGRVIIQPSQRASA